MNSFFKTGISLDLVIVTILAISDMKNRLALGLLVAIVVVLYDDLPCNRSPILGLAARLALFTKIILAVSIGGTVLLVQKKFNVIHRPQAGRC